MESKRSYYLKYWRVIRQYAKVRYEISLSDLDTILFLYSEGYFKKDKFDEFANLTSWDRRRFERLRSAGWIENIRAGVNGAKGLYCLSFKAKRMVTSIYKKLEGEEIPMTAENNPMFKKNVKYSDKVYRNMIRKMNELIKKKNITEQERHLFPE